jgi:hypothetical protein
VQSKRSPTKFIFNFNVELATCRSILEASNSRIAFRSQSILSTVPNENRWPLCYLIGPKCGCLPPRPRDQSFLKLVPLPRQSQHTNKRVITVSPSADIAMACLPASTAPSIDDLPDEVLFDIFLRLDIPELHALSLVQPPIHPPPKTLARPN